MKSKCWPSVLVFYHPSLSPYAYKHNPIEHRTMEGAAFTDYEFVHTLMQKTTTKTGLKLKVRINDLYYPVGIKTGLWK
ncbi:MAG: ISAzo13-like element transposase-related protein [Cyclobacteriaceae bacterium]